MRILALGGGAQVPPPSSHLLATEGTLAESSQRRDKMQPGKKKLSVFLGLVQEKRTKKREEIRQHWQSHRAGHSARQTATSGNSP